MIEIPIAGKVNRYGELFDFPKKLSHFSTVLMGSKPGEVFALVAIEDIPEASILSQDILICDKGKHPQPGDIAILPWGKQGGRWFLCQLYSLTLDEDLDTLEASNQYPIPEDLLDKSYGQRLQWAPISYGEETEEYLLAEAEKDRVPMRPIPPEYVLATVLRLSRFFAF